MISSSEDGSSVTGKGSGQGTIAPEGMSYEEWLEEIAWGIEGSIDEDGANPDADYNGDGLVNRDDFDYYIENKLWNG